MKGPLIKSGESAQGRLILLLIRPDKAGTGQERGVPEPTVPISHSPARLGFDVVLGHETSQPPPYLPPPPTELGWCPWLWLHPGLALQDRHTLGFQQILPQRG